MIDPGSLGDGDVFAGHRVEGVLGRGGMGIVYRATHIALEAPRALKVIAPDLARDDEFRERFRREARLAASLQHPRVVTVHDTGEEEGVLYISMQRVEGTDLAALIARDGRLDPGEATELLAQVADALDAAHGRGLIHRDIKPANVLVEGGPGGRTAYATDFGLTKPIASQSGVTKTGVLIGSIDFMAPEQFAGDPLDARTDVYALGAVYFTALTGEVPFPGSSPVEKMFGHTNRDVPSIRDHVPELPVALDDAVRRALAKDPAGRFQSAGDLGRAATAAAAGEATQPIGSVAAGAAATGLQETEALAAEAPPPPPPRAPAEATRRIAPEPSPRSSGRGPLIAAGAVLAIAGAVAAGFLIAGSGDDGPRNVIKVAGSGGDDTGGGDETGGGDDPGGGDDIAGPGFDLVSYTPEDPGYLYGAEIPEGGGFGSPVEEELTPGELLRTTITGPGGLAVIIDYTPLEEPTFAHAFESKRTVSHPFFGTATEYFFSNEAAFEPCAAASCIDIQFDDGTGGGWAVLAGGPDFALAQDLARQVADSIRP